MDDRGQSGDFSWSTAEYYLAGGLETSYRLSEPEAHPVVLYEVIDDGREIALFVELETGRQPPRSRLPAVLIDRVSHRGMGMVRMRTAHASLLRDFHDMVIAIADRIKSGSSLNVAFAETVRSWNALLDEQRVASVQKRLGLHGELALLDLLAHRFGWDVAMQSWTGPANEERDFALAEFDVEVKTTSTERRRHTVHGLGQLEPSPSRPLWFASIRLTRGGTNGRLLSESVDAVRLASTDESAAAGMRFAELLADAGWQADQYDDERWALRDEPLVLSSRDVPSLKADLVPPSAQDRILSVHYEIDVTGLPQSPNCPLDPSQVRLP